MTTLRDTRVLYHDLFTNGVVYLDIGFDLHTLPAGPAPLRPAVRRALLETGVGNEDFVRLSQRIGRSTGGIRPQRWISAVLDSRAAARLVPARQGGAGTGGELLAILRDILSPRGSTTANGSSSWCWRRRRRWNPPWCPPGRISWTGGCAPISS